MKIVVNTLIITTFLISPNNIEINASSPPGTDKGNNNVRRVEERLTLLPDATPLYVPIRPREKAGLQTPQNNNVVRPQENIILMPDGTPLHVPVRRSQNTISRGQNNVVRHPREQIIVLPDATYMHVLKAHQDNAAHRSPEKNVGPN